MKQAHGPEILEPKRFVRLRYTLPGCTFIVEDELSLVSSVPHFGGRRWWWECRCGKTTATLYLPPETGLYFRCRICCDLTYESSQTHDKRVNFYRKDPRVALDVLERQRIDWTQLRLIIQAHDLGPVGMRRPRRHRRHYRSATCPTPRISWSLATT
jgi:hypothetical protein